MKKMRCWVLLAACLLLSGCAKAEQKQDVQGTEALPATAAQTEGKEDAEKVTENYQFIPGYGICSPGVAPVFYMDPEERPAIESGGARTELLSVVYQNGTMIARTCTIDSTITVVPEQETEELLKKEQDNFQKQEAGETVLWDDSYIKADEEKKLLVRSEFEMKKKEAENQKRSAGEKRFHCVYGAGAPEVGYSFNRTTSTFDYQEVESEGRILTYTEYSMEDKVLETGNPEGVYEICLPGFEDTLRFEFVPSEKLDSLDQLPKYVQQGNNGVYAIASAYEDGIRIQHYTYSDDSMRMEIEPEKCFLEKNGSRYEGKRSDRWWTDNYYTIDGVIRGKQGEILEFEIPEAERNGEFQFQIMELTVAEAQKSEPVIIPIPEKEESMDEVISFAHGKLKLTGVKRLEEDMYYGDINGETVKKPGVFISAEPVDTEENWVFTAATGAQYDAEYEQKDHTYRRMMPVEYEQGQGSVKERKIAGYYAFYEPGDTEIEVEFKNPYYIWKQEFVIPVEIVR